ncbi:hypothetical protein [Alkaliphilus peptidifermentans]|uniref:Uncharacterized protein n=1 Tax=Alkaliphilus peptidifermentans DSM 18978 TaxID=1120976 RepID=A0A1G5JVR9_9FIRM|nr:hypothetical protein [Alkaliphilus peptidifermentans]SCY92264.1 hypothetical protein SAMN03080606_03052 [Alkaliphilus peptidifermentans DSM 18978]
MNFFKRGKNIILLLIVSIILMSTWYVFSNRKMQRTPEKADLVLLEMYEIKG